MINLFPNESNSPNESHSFGLNESNFTNKSYLFTESDSFKDGNRVEMGLKSPFALGKPCKSPFLCPF